MLAEEKLAEKVVMTMALKGAKKIFAANAADKSAEKIVELLKEIGLLLPSIFIGR
jgi:hypothetical protein